MSKHQKYLFVSKLNHQECMSRLRGSINVQLILVTMTRLYTPGTFLGNTSRDRFWIQRAEKGFNSFIPLFRGSCVQSQGETMIVGTFTLHPVTKVLMGVYLLASALLTLVVAIALVASAELRSWMLLPPLMLSGSMWELRKAGASHLDTRTEVLSFLEKTFEAQKQ